MPNTKIVHVEHLGGIDAAYQMPNGYDEKKPTLVLVNSFTTSSELYTGQYANKELNAAMNVISIELLGHGQTRTARENWTYWVRRRSLNRVELKYLSVSIRILGYCIHECTSS